MIRTPRLVIASLAAFQFLTILPPIVRRPFTAEELGRSVGFYPLVGLLLGVLLFGLDSGLRLIFPPQVTAALVLVGWVIFTRALHLDGFLDTCDGLFGAFTPEKRMAILRDSRVGAFGVTGGVLLLLVKYAAILTLTDRLAGLLLAPLLGRWAISLAIAFFPYAREQGLGRDIKDNTRWPQVALATVTALVASWLVAGWLGLLILAIAGLAMWLWVHFVLARLPGLTGDIYGATCELIELLILLFFAAGLPAISN